MKKTAIHVAAAGIMTATLTLGKLALSWLPNIETVTLFICLYAVVFDSRTSFISAICFVAIEAALYGGNVSWVICYLIYFPSLAFLVKIPMRLSAKFPKLKPLIYAISAFVFTMAFDILTVAVDTIMFGATFYVRFLSGLVFFIVHEAGNFAIFLVAFVPLEKVLLKIKKRLSW